MSSVMTKPILYFTAASPPARAVLLLLRNLDIDVEVKTLNLLNREQYSEELYPAHEVPTLVDGDFVLTESRAILAYLINSRNPGSNLYPTDPKDRARVDQRLSYDHVLFSKNAALVRPVLFGEVTSTTQQAKDGVVDVLKVIDTFLESYKWIAGDNLTIADFSAVATISTTVELGYDLAKHSNIERWYKQCETLKGFEENLQGAATLAAVIKSKVEGTVF